MPILLGILLGICSRVFFYHAGFAQDYSQDLFEVFFCHAESPLFGNSGIIACSIITYHYFNKESAALYKHCPC